LAKNPKGRYQSPDELLRDLERVRAGKRVKPISRKRVVAFIGAGILTGLLAVGATWFFTLNRAEAGLAQAIQKADVAVASQDYLAAKKSLEDAIAAVPNWLPNKSGLVAPAYSKLQTFAAGAREQQASIDKAEAKRKEAAALAAYKKHDQDAITVIASIKAKTAAGDYRQAIAAANAAIKDFSDTPSGKELPDLLAAATKELRAVQEAEEARQAAEAKARDERFVKYRDEGDALLATGQFEQAQLSYENALKEKTDTVVRTRLERCIKAQAEAKLKHNHAAQAAVADIKTKIAAGQYQQAIAAANEAIKFFEDTSIGMELPDLLADATGKLKGAQEAQRQDALARKKDCDSAAQAAQAAGAQTFARDFWDLAEASAGAAQYSFDQGDFPQATELWKKAAGGYEEASVETKRFQRDRTLDLGNKVTMKLAIIPPGKFRAPRCLVWVDSWTLAGSS